MIVVEEDWDDSGSVTFPSIWTVSSMSFVLF